MAFSSAELANIANAALDYYIDQGNVYANTLADKPLLNLMDGKAKTFPGGKSDLSVAVKGVYTTSVAGYTHNDTVSYANPANIQSTRRTKRLSLQRPTYPRCKNISTSPNLCAKKPSTFSNLYNQTG